ncbi:MAG: hypothetical protein QOC87_841 [Actinomycetota bacterium]|nr:hypothetical protein [Actinomycetota bacterium]
MTSILIASIEKSVGRVKGDGPLISVYVADYLRHQWDQTGPGRCVERQQILGRAGNDLGHGSKRRSIRRDGSHTDQLVVPELTFFERSQVRRGHEQGAAQYLRVVAAVDAEKLHQQALSVRARRFDRQDRAIRALQG